MELFHEQVHIVKYLKTKYQEYDYGVYSESFREPYILKYHKKYFFAAYDQFTRTNQNHKFWQYFLLLLKYFQVLYLDESNLIYVNNKYQNKLEWKNKMQCLRLKTFPFLWDKKDFLLKHIRVQDKLLFYLQKMYKVDKCIHD